MQQWKVTNRLERPVGPDDDTIEETTQTLVQRFRAWGGKYQSAMFFMLYCILISLMVSYRSPARSRLCGGVAIECRTLSRSGLTPPPCSFGVTVFIYLLFAILV